MALSYRSPIEEVLSSFTTLEQSTISAVAVQGYKDIESNRFKFFNYVMPAMAKQKLNESGVYLSPFSAMPHSHPVCKTLENYFLYQVLPSYIDNSFYFVGIKQGKLDFLKSKCAQASAIEVINRLVTSKDKFRYPATLWINRTKKPLSVQMLRRQREIAQCDTLRELIPEVIRLKSRKLFMHDELHYWGLEELTTFLEITKPEILLGTLVYPPELLAGAKESLNKWCYEFEIKDGELFFYPDGVKSEGYLQPVKNGYLLRTKKIILLDNTCYTVNLLHSRFAHHLVSITKDDLKVPSHNCFSGFEAVSGEFLEPIMKSRMKALPISYGTVSKIYRYLRTLVKPDMQSAMAKLGQLVPEPSSFEIKFIQEFSELVIKSKQINSMINSSLFDNFFATLLGTLPNELAKKSRLFREWTLDEFVCNLKPFSFNVPLETVKCSLPDFGISRNSCAEGDYDLAFEMEMKFESPVESRIPELGCRQPAKYSSCSPYIDELEVNEATLRFLIEVLAKYIVNSLRIFNHNIVSSASFVDTLMNFMSSKNILSLLRNRVDVELLRRVKLRVQKICISEKLSCSLYFRNGARRWFESNQRKNVRAICDNPELSRVSWETAVLYSSCVNEIIKKKEKSIIEENMEVQGLKSGPPTPHVAVHSMVEVEDVSEDDCPKVESVTPSPAQMPIEVKEQMQLIEELRREAAAVAQNAVDCGCNFEIGIGKTMGCRFMEFQTPDRLYNRNCGWYSKVACEYGYNGGYHKSLGWNECFDKFLELNNFGHLNFDCVLIQEYDKNAKIGFHADDEPTLDPGTPILTVAYSGDCIFKIKCGKKMQSFKLASGDFILMPEGFQAHHKHAISDCSLNRTSLTFRRLNKNLYKPHEGNVEPLQGEEEECTKEVFIDENQNISTSDEEDVKFTDGLTAVEILGVELTCRKGACIDNFKVEKVPGDGNCFWHSVGFFMGVDGSELKNATRALLIKEMNYDPELQEQMQGSNYSENEAIAAFCRIHCVKLNVYDHDRDLRWVFTPSYYSSCLSVLLADLHFDPLLPRNDCVAEAIAECLGRDKKDIFKVMAKKENSRVREEMYSGEGVSSQTIEKLLRIFGIRGLIDWEGELEILNPSGKIEACFEVKDEHMTHLKGDLSKHCKPKVVQIGKASRISVKSLESAGNCKEYEVDEERACRLARLLHEGNTGAISSHLFNDEVNILESSKNSRNKKFGFKRDVTAIVGTFGAGKSTLFKIFFNQNPGKNISFVSPRKALADEFKMNIFGKSAHKKASKVIVKRNKRNMNWNVQTFEIFLKQLEEIDESHTIILDEMQLYPPGYLDLVLSLVPISTKVFVVGDPCQSDYDSEKDRAAFSGVEGDFNRLLGGEFYNYVIRSRRFKNRVFLNRIPCKFDMEQINMEEPYLMLQSMEELVNARSEFSDNILVSSFDEKKIVKAYIKKEHTCCTFGESTGRTFNFATIIITPCSSMVSEKRWITALSRAALNVCIVNLTGTSFESIAIEYKDRALGRFLTGTASPEDLRDVLPGKPCFIESFGGKIGKDFFVREDKMRGDPWLKAMIEIAQKEDQEMEEMQEEFSQEPWFKTHLPKCELEGVRAQWVHKIMAKEEREMRIKELISNQFTDQHSKNRGQQLTNAAERFETIYPRHRPNDTVTFLMAVRKRLRFSKPQVECGKLKNAELYGKYLLDIFLKLVPLKSNHNHAFMQKAKSDFEDKKTSKSAAVIENHAGRSCRDWLADVGLVFMKSQLCTKFEKRFAMAKAAQTIVCFQHSVLCRFAPYMRYIEMKLHESLPKKFYIHSGKGLDELNDWVKANNFSGICTESDYEAFDASQDEYIVAFELALMRYLGLPKDLIEDYKYIKTHLGSKLGSFSIMRFSGEASTFLFNTMANMLFTFMRYDLNGKESICFAGDDMCASKSLRLSLEHEDFLKKLKLKAKVDKTAKPTFCGWHLSADGIYKKPQLVLERMCIARETNNLQNCLDNYAIEVSFAYLLGEKAVCRMNEEELNSYYNCVRIIVKNKHLLKSEVARVFESA